MLSQAQRAVVQRAKTLGGGGQGVALTDAECVGLLAIVLSDLGKLEGVPGLPRTAPDFFEPDALDGIYVDGIDFLPAFEIAVELDKNADTYFECLAALHKSRLKFRKIVATQPFATLDQVGARALLQFGTFPPAELVALLTWRKWLFDLDNRAAQETGYLFEPIIASAIGGVPASAYQSPVRRRSDSSRGRQVDCIMEQDAYEFKIRVTVAASGQGR